MWHALFTIEKQFDAHVNRNQFRLGRLKHSELVYGSVSAQTLTNDKYDDKNFLEILCAQITFSYI